MEFIRAAKLSILGLGTACFAIGMAAGFSYTAHAASNPAHQKSAKLDDKNIAAFIQEMTGVIMGARETMSDDDVLLYLNRHIASGAIMKSAVEYQIPGFPSQTKPLEYNKTDYIQASVENRERMKDFTTALEVSEIRMGPARKSASFKSTSSDRGHITVPMEDGPKTVPVTGKTICTQSIKLEGEFIQLTSADCQTLIKFDAWQGKPLESEW